MNSNQWEVETWKTGGNVKGPRTSWLVVIDEQECVATVSGNPSSKRTRMNASLIGAAPLLLSALSDLIAMYPPDMPDEKLPATVRNARIAISQATRI